MDYKGNEKDISTLCCFNSSKTWLNTVLPASSCWLPSIPAKSTGIAWYSGLTGGPDGSCRVREMPQEAAPEGNMLKRLVVDRDASGAPAAGGI